MTLRALYVDFNSYFASCEQHDRPALRGRPVGVVPMMADTTCCIAASYPAKAFGVKTGTMVAEAKRLCPEIVLVEARPARYVELHHQLVAAVDTCVPVERVNSIDEMNCSLSGSHQRPDIAKKLGEKIKRTIARTVGEHLLCSIGIAPNEFLAKTASDMKKPNGLTVIEAHDLPHKLHTLELRDLCGIGRNMEQRLLAGGIRTVAHLCAANVHTLRTVWGGVEGERLHARLRGELMPRPPTQRASIGHSHVLAPSLRTHDRAAAVLHRLTQKAAMRLRDYRYLAGVISLTIKYRNGQRWDAQQPLDPTDATRTFLAAIRALWAADEPWKRRTQPVAVGVTLGGLVDKRFRSLSLFGEPSQEPLDAAVDDINLRFGKNSVYFGGAHLALHAAPMRIAFNHVPDLKTEGDERRRGRKTLAKPVP
jgi:DNA polymerase-4